MKIVILVPDGIGIRNYLYSDLLKYLTSHEIVLLHRLPPFVLEEINHLQKTPFDSMALPPLLESKSIVFFRRICNYARLFRHAAIAKNPSISQNWLLFSVAKGTFKANHTLARFLGRCIAAIPGALNKAEGLLNKQTLNSSLANWTREKILAIEPDIVFCTHQRSIDGGYIMAMAKKMGIKTATVIFSWDNLPKSRMTFRADYYFVWSHWMKEELIKFYPEIHPADVMITGTPQFECYVKKELIWSEQDFREKLGLPAQGDLICFSGNEPTFPSDHLYLHDLLIQMKNSPDQQSLPFVLVRPSPADHTDRFEKIITGFEQYAKVCRPEWQLTGERSWESYYPKASDVALLNNMVHHCAAVINVGSTMGIDFAHANKPALYIKYNHPDCPHFNLVLGYNQEHFSTLRNKDAVAWIESSSQFLSLVIQAVHHPQTLAKDRLAWKKQIMDNIYNASQKIAEALQTT